MLPLSYIFVAFFIACVIQAKTTKKIVLRMECTTCKQRKQLPIKRCKHFELGGDKKRKVCFVYIHIAVYDKSALQPETFSEWDGSHTT